MLLNQKFVFLLFYSILLVLLVVGDDDSEYDNLYPPFPILKGQLVDQRSNVTATSYILEVVTPDNGVDEHGVNQIFIKLRRDMTTNNYPEKIVCICMYTNEGGYSNQNSRECSQQSRICFYNHHDCFGKTKQNDICDADVFNDPNTNRKYFDYHIIVKKNKAIIKSQAGDAEFEIANISPIYDNKYPELKIAVVSFYKNNHGIHDCSDPSNPKCQHTDSLYILTRPNNPNKGQIPNQNGGGNNGNAEIIESTTPNFLTSPLSPVKSTEAASNAGFTAVYIIVGIVVAIALIIILLCILRCYQGIWCCGLLCCKKEETEEENIKKKYKFTGSKEVNQGSGSNDKPGDVEKGKNGEEVVQQQKSGDLKVSFQGREFLQTTQPTQTHTTLTEDQKKPLEEVVVAKKKEEKKDEKTSKSSSSSAAAAAETKDKEKEKTTKPQKRAQAPNMLLLATREDETQSEARSPSKRKTKVEKNNKEPPPTKNVTQDAGAPTTKGIATGKAATTMKATAIARTEAAKTGLPKSETELVTDEKAPGPATKGVSATQGDKTTAAKGTTKVAPTQTYVGTQTTQGGATTAGGKTKKTQETGMITGVGKTRLTGATQMPTADTNETQNPTGATKTKPTQFATGATQRLTTGTTQAGTGTTQRGTTMATGKTQMGTNPTQARTSATRQTGETQNPDEADIDFTQIPGTVATRGSGGGGTGGTRPTQMPSDADADPTQNPTAFTGGGGTEGGGKTSKTQFGTTGATNQTQAGTSKTRTRDTQKQTNRTDAM